MKQKRNKKKNLKSFSKQNENKKNGLKVQSSFIYNKDTAIIELHEDKVFQLKSAPKQHIQDTTQATSTKKKLNYNI